MSNWRKPWLQRRHRNFFIMYCVTIAFNVWAAINGLFASGVWFQISVLEYVNLVPHELWGLAYLVGAYVAQLLEPPVNPSTIIV